MIPYVVKDVARAIYHYAGTQGLPQFEDLPPTVQISYIEESEAALKTVVKHIKFLATQIEPSSVQPLAMSVMMALAETLDPTSEPAGQ